MQKFAAGNTHQRLRRGFHAEQFAECHVDHFDGALAILHYARVGDILNQVQQVGALHVGRGFLGLVHADVAKPAGDSGDFAAPALAGRQLQFNRHLRAFCRQCDFEQGGRGLALENSRQRLFEARAIFRCEDVGDRIIRLASDPSRERRRGVNNTTVRIDFEYGFVEGFDELFLGRHDAMLPME